MLDIFLSGGWIMWPLLACSVLALAIVLERLWSLNTKKIVPEGLVQRVLHAIANRQQDSFRVQDLAQESPLGSMIAKGLQHSEQGLNTMRQRMEEHGRQVMAKLERYVNALGTIAAITPLLGLLGTVIGMIQVFTVITSQGATESEALAGGIAQALITTAFGLSIAIPSLMFHRYFERKLDELSIQLEREATCLVEGLKVMAPKVRQQYRD
jgi:biopolymer transport protein ExbB